MHKVTTVHVYPDDHYDDLKFVSNKDGTVDDKSIGDISAFDLEGDECHLPNVKASAIVKFFADFIQIEDVLREKEYGNKASSDTMKHLQTIKNKLDKWLEPPKEKQWSVLNAVA